MREQGQAKPWVSSCGLPGDAKFVRLRSAWAFLEEHVETPSRNSELSSRDRIAAAPKMRPGGDRTEKTA